MNVRALSWSLAALFVFSALLAGSAVGQLIHQEGFNDDGDGSRYTMTGRGFEILPVGPGMWEHNFNASRIGLVGAAPARRAAILWTHNHAFASLDGPPAGDFEVAAFDLWTNVANWAMDGKQAATIGFFPSHGENDISLESVFALSELFQSQGHTVVSFADTASLPPAATAADEVDLIIHTNEANVTPETFFADYPVPGIFFNAGNHDDTLIATIGATHTIDGALSLNVVSDNADHPVLEGLPNPLPFTSDFTAGLVLQGMGSAPPGGEVLLTFTDPATSQEMPALIVVEEGGGLLGSFGPEPEGTGFIVGADMNEAFGGGTFTDAMNPRTLELNPVSISGQEDVRVTVALSAVISDFENPDFLRISAGEAGSFPEEFTVLSEYIPVDEAGNPCNKGLSNDGGMTCLSPLEFTDVEFNITELAPDIDNLVVRFEAFSTFPNEVLGIDNVRIHSGPLIVVPPPVDLPGDYNGNGTVEQADLDLVLLNWGASFDSLPAEWVNEVPTEGIVAQAQLDGVLLNWGNTAMMVGAAAGVPEPSTIVTTLLVVLGAAFVRIRTCWTK